ncbi:AraC family transcriptional regulator [Vibrio ostreae]|uniref:AraC family transcriptional regulator n=1 Tax=Vibrio ostreae TaxID=2841925 RepID=A0A975U6D1_9VIBR|nr:AraC family transcriptional regulator [Vibrio ostreae]QXO16044.1 AraC family transcriptional regulator [Vibrio ostreae]
MQEQFQYLPSQHIHGLSAFSAQMKEFSYDKHAHEEYSIGVTRKGRQDFFSDGVFHKSNAGNVMLFNPEQVHDGSAGARSELQYEMLYIPQATLTNLMRSLGHISDDQIRLKSSIFNDHALRSQVLNLSQMMGQAALSALEEEAALLAIAQSVIRLGGGTFHSGNYHQRKDTLLLRAKEYILCNLSQKMTVDEICQAANMSKYHFIREFNQQFGMTPHQYVLNCRINRAKQALHTGDKVSDVAVNFGFSDVSHLNRKFKKSFGITPHQYQRQLNV